MEAPPPWLSPERTAWAAAVAPWLMVWVRFRRCAQAGGAEVGDAADAPSLAVLPVMAPPVISTALLAPPR